MRSKLSYHTTCSTSQLGILNLVSKAHLSYIMTFSFVTDKQERVLSQSEQGRCLDGRMTGLKINHTSCPYSANAP